ncbi:MAG: phosphodiester glycosidase family protein, partial [Firmicutes bacterium]|nr:phosphodiester glycosidase family protein [Bacillota bacterium]
MKQKRKRWSFGAVTALALTVFTGYALLDTFIIPRSYGTVPQTVEVAAEEVQEAVQETSVQEEIEQEETTQDGITVELTEYRENDTTIYVADVWVQDPSQLKTALAGGTYGKNVKNATSDIAEDVDAILAVNGDF